MDFFKAIELATQQWKLAHTVETKAEPSYWDEKKKDRREEFLREDAENRERVDAGFPRDKP